MDGSDNKATAEIRLNAAKKYSHMWREGGQFSTEKYNIDNLDRNNIK